MKRFIVPFLITLCSFSAFGIDFAHSPFKYIKYNGGLELIIKKQTYPDWKKCQIFEYGIRKNGIEVLEPKYKSEDVALPADLFLLVFMDTQNRTAHVYSIETGEEILTRQWTDSLSENQEKFLRFEFREIYVDGRRNYQLIEQIEKDGILTENIIATFFRRRMTYMSQPDKRPTPICDHY